MNLYLSNVILHSSSHNFPIEMILEWRAGNISTCLPILLNYEVEFGIGEWMQLWMNWEFQFDWIL